MPHCIKETVSYYTNRKLEEVQFPIKLYLKNFFKKNYTEFSKEQLVFEEDTLYMCIY